MMRSLQLSLLALYLSLLITSTSAYGGIFGRKAPNQEVTSDAGDSIIFAIQEATQKVQLQVQLQYENAPQGEDETFGWILPVPAVPTKLEIGSSVLFRSLFRETVPTFVLDVQSPNVSVGRSGFNYNMAAGLGETCSEEAIEGQNCPLQGPTRGGNDNDGGSLNLLSQGQAGIASFEVVEGSKQELMDWLQNKDWTANTQTDLSTLLDYYDAYGSVYVVLEVTTNKGGSQQTSSSGGIQPILIEYDLPPTQQQGQQVVHRVPTLLSASSPRTLQVYFLNDQVNTRAVPVNYLDVELNDIHVDWVGCLGAEGGPDACYYKDYQQRYRNAVLSAGTQQTMTTEYSGYSIILLSDNKQIAMNVDLTSLETSANWLEYLQQLEVAGVPGNDPYIQTILDQYIPPKSFMALPPFQCVQWEHVYQPGRTTNPQMDDCFGLFSPPDGWTWDPVGLTAALEAAIFAPARAAETMVSSMKSLTRLYGELLEPTKTPEPHFLLSQNLPMVSNIHRATAIPLCDIGSPSTLEITLQDSTAETTTFWQPAILSCPTWAKTSPRPILDPKTETTGKVNSLASLFTAWGGQNTPHVVSPNADGQFSNEDINDALEYGDATLTAISDRPDGSFPGVPLSGTTYIDLTGVVDFESNSYQNSNGSSSIRRRSGIVAVTTATLGMVVALVAQLV